MARRLRWSPRAADDLESACRFIEQHSPEYASLLARRVVALLEDLLEYPQLGREVPEYGNPALRERIFHRYRIVYRVTEESIEIVTIVHQARSFPTDL